MSKEQRILKLWKAGKGVGEIAIIMGMKPAEVWDVIKVQTAGCP